MSTPKSRKVLGAAVMALSLGLGVGATIAPTPISAAAVEQPTLEARVKDVIEHDALQFKDLNDNGALDPYEDWRLSVEERVADLVSQMTIEEKSGLMLINTLNAGCEGTVANPATDYIQNQYMHRFILRNVVDSASTPCGTSGTPRVTPAQAAEFTNAVQEMTEATRLGIPSLFKSNARNHIDHDARVGINEAAGAFSAFPKEAGVASAALGDPEYMGVVEDFATVMGDEWASIGLRGMYGYMADLSTDPRWYRVHETFTEDSDLGADIMGTLVETLQGPVDADGVSLSPDTDVALTMKHFPGGGPQTLGLDPHYAHGKDQTYPGSGFEDALKPFQTAIDAGVAAIMPYYGVPVDVTYNGVTFDEVGFAFSEQIVEWLLRDQLGFKGYVNSDTGIINDRAWGLEDSTVPERVAAAVNGGTDTLSGFSNVSVILDLVNAGLITEERVDLAAERLLTPLFQLGLFEDPYVDPAVATATVGADEHRAVAQEVQRKSVVLLQNSGVLPLAGNQDVFVMGAYNEDQVAEAGFQVINGNEAGVEAAADADVAVINVTAATDRSVTGAYRSNFTDTGWFNPATRSFTDTDDLSTNADFYVVGGLDPEYGHNPVVLEGVPGLDGNSPWGASDRCVFEGGTEAINNPNPTPSCTDNRLGFGGALPWESNILDFTGMAESQSWKITPSLDEIQAVMDEVGAENTVLSVYFRQPYVLDEASGLQDAGAIVAGFGVTDAALWDVLSGNFAPQGKMPFALANNVEAIETQAPDLPGYDAEDTLFPFGFGLTYEAGVELAELAAELEAHIASGDVAGPIAKQLTSALEQASKHQAEGRTEPATVALERFQRLLDNPKKPDTLSADAQADLGGRAEVIVGLL
ncbi:glycoside hydrolase family 3 C-terminal domain-containing protein [Tessaracoccus sp. OS52]|uniref:glycoside hydrolase family 3 protein n=1 Tax=Tessaracoccus sp. OS52 TaxID=2886691 RepID=UPI001D11D235|nr:glycoside hydrolase family 3 N-terminal domain-containing protein [Tessaracoccus sp. OS52]MCC2594164.1 glycoside hydrolase family 3 C-terminal domain-containing protein [Tessaracoccus sp. OS52]